MKNKRIKVGSRASRLALAQTEIVIRRLEAIYPRFTFTVVPIRTAGDRITSAAELRRAGKGLFTKEIERALLKRKISMAVHSMKDLPTTLPEGLALGAILERNDASDVFVGRSTPALEKLRPRAHVGTSSLRRQAILRSVFPQLEFTDLKGNLDTRLEKLRDPRSKLEGIVIAAAGLERLYGQNGVPAQTLPRNILVPAAGQGALGVEIRLKDEDLRKLLEPIHDIPTAACVMAEREVLRRLEGGCQVPLGVHGEASEDGTMTLTACLASLDGKQILRETQTGLIEDPLTLAESLEMTLRSRGAAEILRGPRRSRSKPKPRRKSKPKTRGRSKPKPRRRSKPKPRRRSKPQRRRPRRRGRR